MPDLLDPDGLAPCRMRGGASAFLAWERHNPRLRLTLLLLTLSAPWLEAEEWPNYGNDPGGTRYSALEQINRQNVAALEVAWEFDSPDFADGQTGTPTRSAFEATPLMIDGTLYVPTPLDRLLALDAATGRKLWEFDTKLDRSLRRNLFINRGLGYWKQGQTERLVLGGQSGLVYSIDRKTGKLDPAFANGGILDITPSALEHGVEGRYSLTSPIQQCASTLVVGGLVTDGLPKGPNGDIRGYDVHTGDLRWRFHTVPRPGEFGHETWGGDSWKLRGGTNLWTIASVDEELGLAYVALGSPSHDYYGGDRPGANLFGNSLVAIDCRTGSRRWHFQSIHHDIWDWDLPSQPSLIEVVRDGKPVKAVAIATKTGFVFVFNRATGEPLFDIEEHAVPAGDLPGEYYHPTQPKPVLPKPFIRQSMREGEITTVTEESRTECMEMLEGASIEGPLFRPRLRQKTVFFPGTNGGSNWGGGAFDPETDTFYINSMDVGSLAAMVSRGEDAELPWRSRSVPQGRFWDSNLYPCQPPPWGHLTAIDLNTGAFRWRKVLGEYDELTKRGVPPTGAANLGGPIVTKGGLVFIAATNDKRFRAFDKDSGDLLWEYRLPASAHATPMTYVAGGQQYIAIAVGGGNKYNPGSFMAKVMAFRLPAQQ